MLFNILYLLLYFLKRIIERCQNIIKLYLYVHQNYEQNCFITVIVNYLTRKINNRNKTTDIQIFIIKNQSIEVISKYHSLLEQ